MARQRDGGVEVFRCLMMILVVLHHACGEGIFKETFAAEVLFVPTVLAVDGFLAISGWYGLRFNWRKAGALWGLHVFYGLLYMLALAVLAWLGYDVRVHLSLGASWFIPVYLALMAVSPLINSGLEDLARQGRRALWGAYLPFMVLMALSWLPKVGVYLGFSVRGWGSHMFGQALFVYVTLRVLRLSGLGERLSKRQVWLLLGLFGGLFAVCAVSGMFLLWMKKGAYTCYAFSGLLGYNALPVVFCAAASLLLFTRLRVPAWLARTASFIGPSLFAIYILHNANLTGRHVWLPLCERFLVSHAAWLTPWGILLTETAMAFTLCLAVDLIRRALWAGLCAWRRRSLGVGHN